MHNYPSICFAGSMKFFDVMLEKAISFSQQGFIVLMPIKDNRPTITKAEKAQYVRMQRTRIDMCNNLYVVDPNGYIGEDTKEEIQYAINQGKSIEYMCPPEHPKIYTLIGSRKFLAEFKRVTKELTLQGHIVHVPSIFYVDVNDMGSLTEHEHETFDAVHRIKMDNSDVVLVINCGGYIGEDTKEEIDYALDHNLKVEYLCSYNKDEDEAIL